MPTWPCPDCGAKKGDPHKPACSRAQNRRRAAKPGKNPSGLPKGKGKLSTCVKHKPVVYKTRGDTEYLECSTCSRHLGSRKKKLGGFTAVGVDGAVKQVIVIRKDLKMRRGKEIAQGSHASMAWLTKRCLSHTSMGLHDVAFGGRFSDPEWAWIQGGFRKVTVQVGSEEDLLRVHEAAVAAGLVSELIQDSGATEFGGVPTYTACAVGPDYDSKIDPVTGMLKLY